LGAEFGSLCAKARVADNAVAAMVAVRAAYFMYSSLLWSRLLVERYSEAIPYRP
jgi:hypothetical protein